MKINTQMLINEVVIDPVNPEKDEVEHSKDEAPVFDDALWGDSGTNQDSFFENIKKKFVKPIREEEDEIIFIRDKTGEANIELLHNSKLNKDGIAQWEDDDDFVVDLKNKKRLRKLRSSFVENQVNASEYENRLRAQYEKLHPTPEWSRRKEEIELNKLNEYYHLLNNSTVILKGPSNVSLDERSIKVTRIQDILPQVTRTKIPTVATCFHSGQPIICTAHKDGVLRIYYLNDDKNVLFESIMFENFPIINIAISPDSKEIMIIAKEMHFYTLKTKSGELSKHTLTGFFVSRMNRSHTLGSSPISNFCFSNDNKYIALIFSSCVVALVHRITKQLCAQLRISEPICATRFCSHNEYLYVLSTLGRIFMFELDSKKCIFKFQDKLSYKVRNFDVSPCGSYIALGCASGVVNIYKQTIHKSTIQLHLLKSVMNITTSVDILKFNPFGHILAISSPSKKDSLRLINMSNLSVYPNWPTSNTPLGYVKTISFSSDSKYLAIGNSKGRIIMYKLNEYWS